MAGKLQETRLRRGRPTRVPDSIPAWFCTPIRGMSRWAAGRSIEEISVGGEMHRRTPATHQQRTQAIIPVRCAPLSGWPEV
ncbi:hypothetical protein VTN00DRAFT_9514 [Thermoascus crustaceus]|uniref:uncharacterized protein n=1 Tax=Thermoascus crustaceus TaxID=5088 RepID=UPI003742C6B7